MSLKTLFERKLVEANNLKLVAFFPGRFQPFHKGHKGVYDSLVEMCGVENVYILTSNDTSTYRSPLSFEDKVLVITRMYGIPREHIIQTSTPYRVPREIGIDQYTTVGVFAVSAKDMQEDPRFQFPGDGSDALRQDGEPTYMQKYPGSPTSCEPLATHAYVMTVDVHEFDVGGVAITSATDIRAKLVGPEDEARVAFVDVFGHFDQEVFDMLRQRITDKTLQLEGVTPHVYDIDVPGNFFDHYYADDERTHAVHGRDKRTTVYCGASATAAASIVRGGLKRGSHVTGSQREALYWATMAALDDPKGGAVLEIPLGDACVGRGDQTNNVSHGRVKTTIRGCRIVQTVSHAEARRVETRIGEW